MVELGRCWQFSHRRALNCLARLTVFNWSWLESSVTSIVVDTSDSQPSHLPFGLRLRLPLLPCISFTLLSLCSLRLSIDCSCSVSLEVELALSLSISLYVYLSLSSSLCLVTNLIFNQFLTQATRSSLGGSYGKVFGTVNGSLLQLAVKQADAALCP